MLTSWRRAFERLPFYSPERMASGTLPRVNSLDRLCRFLDVVHIRHALLRPFFEEPHYPLVETRELLPSFEADLFEYIDLPGFSMVAFNRRLNSFREIFQYDVLSPAPGHNNMRDGRTPQAVHASNMSSCLSRLPRYLQKEFRERFQGQDITSIAAYDMIFPYLLRMDRAHVLAHDPQRHYHLAGIYASFPSNLDRELKRFGLKIGKFSANDDLLYEVNRNFVYQFLMELYGFPIVAERRSSAAMFARQLFKLGEPFLVRVIGQSDRTLTTLANLPQCRAYPCVTKTALLRMDREHGDLSDTLEKRGFIIGEGSSRAVILRITYKQHNYSPHNIREERALSIAAQEIIHPVTGHALKGVSLIRETTFMTVKLNDIVRGEFIGRIKYKREIVENTDSHEKRLKFIHAWLNKNQRRIVSYSDDFFASMAKVLVTYLLNPEYEDAFTRHADLYAEVRSKYNYILQARKARELEDLLNRKEKSSSNSVLAMYEQAVEIMQEVKFELVSYFDDLVEKFILIGEQMLNESYVIKKYIQPPADDLTPYGQKVRQMYGRLVTLVDEFTSIRRSHADQTDAA